MSRKIPGMFHVVGREFQYIEVFENEGFVELTDMVFHCDPDVPIVDGGALEEKVRLHLDKGRCLLGLSYKGDIEGWRRKLAAFCNATDRVWGVAVRGKLSLSDGSEVQLDESNVTFDP